MTRYESTGVGTMGGRGQERPIPEDSVQHWLTIHHGDDSSTHPDHFVSAQEAMDRRCRRLKDQGIKFTRIHDAISYTERDGTQTILAYQVAS